MLLLPHFCPLHAVILQKMCTLIITEANSAKRLAQNCRASIKCSFLLASMHPHSFKTVGLVENSLQLSKLEKEIHLFVGTNVRHTSICPLSQWYKKRKNLHYGLCV